MQHRQLMICFIVIASIVVVWIALILVLWLVAGPKRLITRLINYGAQKFKASVAWNLLKLKIRDFASQKGE